MVGRRDQHELVVEQRRGDDTLGDMGGHRTERQVDAVVGEVVEQGPHTAGTQFELDVRMSGVERRERTREVERVERLDRADAHTADDGPGQRGEIGARPVELGEHATGASQEQLTRVRERDVPGAAGEQRGAQLRLELADLHRDRGLGDVQDRRGPAETTLPHHGVEVDELPEFHSERL